jgi:hypothetical protein
MREVLAVGVLSVLAFAAIGCGGPETVAPSKHEEQDKLGTMRFSGAVTTVFVASKQAFDELGVEHTSSRTNEALSGSLPTRALTDRPVLVNLTFTDRGGSTIVDCVTYNVKAGPAEKKRIQDLVFSTIASRLKKLSAGR